MAKPGNTWIGEPLPWYDTIQSNILRVISIRSQMTNFRLLQTERVCADDSFKFDENGRKFSKRRENTLGKGEIAHYEQFLLFPQCFQKTHTADMSKQGLVWERVKLGMCGKGLMQYSYYFTGLAIHIDLPDNSASRPRMHSVTPLGKYLDIVTTF